MVDAHYVLVEVGRVELTTSDAAHRACADAALGSRKHVKERTILDVYHGHLGRLARDVQGGQTKFLAEACLHAAQEAQIVLERIANNVRRAHRHRRHRS